MDRSRRCTRAARVLLALAGAALAILAAGCGGEAATPEERVRATLAAIERDAEARDLGAAKAHVSERYEDASGNDRRAVVALLAQTFLRNAAIHLLTRVDALEIGPDGLARARVFVGMANAPIEALGDLARLRADLYRFDLTLAEEDDDWRVVRAAWARATPAEVMGAAEGGR